MTEPPVVSVVMPAFNAADTVAHAVRSVLAQSVSALELIVCDDASSDGTVAVLQGFDDPRLSVLVNDRNLGPGPSRDRAIVAALSPWIALIDADDAWAPNRLERLLGALGVDRDVLVFDDVLICHDAKGSMVPWRPVHGRRAFGNSGHGACDLSLAAYVRSQRLLIQPIMPAHLIRKHGLRHSERRFAEDAEFIIRLALTGVRLRYLPEALYWYRVTPGSLTAHAKDQSLMRRCLEDCARLDAVPDSVRDALEEKIASLRVNESLYALAHQLRQGHVISALRLLGGEPELMRVLPVRLTRHLAYQVDRLRWGGHGR